MEKQISILILNHGCFGEELIKSAELIVGKTSNIKAVSLLTGMSIEDYYEAIKKVIKELQGETIILTDLYGGTPSNVAMMLKREYKLRVVCGVNLPMLIELLLSRSNTNKDIDTLVSSAFEAGIHAIFIPEDICVDIEEEKEG